LAVVALVETHNILVQPRLVLYGELAAEVVEAEYSMD